MKGEEEPLKVDGDFPDPEDMKKFINGEIPDPRIRFIGDWKEIK